MRRYLITGGAGFIGSHLADSLIAEGQAVRVIDNLFSGRMENLPAGAELVQGDVICQHAVRSALEGVDGCFHLAAIASVEFCHEGWLRGHVVNLGGAITIFEEVRRAQRLCGRYIPIVYASSAAVYGNATKLPLSEASPTAPANAYGVDKLACELHAAVGSRLHDLSIVGLRFFNIYVRDRIRSRRIQAQFQFFVERYWTESRSRSTATAPRSAISSMLMMPLWHCVERCPSRGRERRGFSTCALAGERKFASSPKPWLGFAMSPLRHDMRQQEKPMCECLWAIPVAPEMNSDS